MNHGMSVKSTIVLSLVFILLFSPLLALSHSTAFSASSSSSSESNGKHLHSTDETVRTVSTIEEKGNVNSSLKQNNVSSEANKQEREETENENQSKEETRKVEERTELEGKGEGRREDKETKVEKKEKESGRKRNGGEKNRDLLLLCPSFCSCSQNEQYVNCFQVERESSEENSEEREENVEQESKRRRRSDLDLSLSVPGLERRKLSSSFLPSLSSLPSSSSHSSPLVPSFTNPKNLFVSKEENVSMRKECTECIERNERNRERIVEPYKLVVVRNKESFLQQNVTKTVLELKLKGGSIEEIEKESFSSLTILQSLDLSNNLIKNISKETFSGLRSLQYLNLSFNKIEVLLGETFSHLSQLQHLELQYNEVRIVSKESFHGLYRLRHLNMEGNHIKSFDPRTLIHLTRMTHLLLGHNNMSSFDQVEILSPLVQVLDLSGNELNHVPTGMHPFVRNLKLSQNSIRRIQLDDWDNFGSITWIVLDHNLIREVTADSFAHLQLLVGISFLGNRLREVPVNLPSNLRHLNLEGNELVRLEASSFHGLWILEHLQLSRNQIKIIDPVTFCALSNLHSLHLDGNQIEHLSSNIFHNLTRLQLLDLSRNPIKELPSDAFTGLKALKWLGLNDLDSIQAKRDGGEKDGEEKDGGEKDERDKGKKSGLSAFSHFTSLSSLELSKSSSLALQVLSPSQLGHLTSLKNIDLSGNNLTTLPIKLPTFLPQLQSVNILNNQWNCTGNQLDWISNWLRKFPELFIHPLNITCFYPSQLSGVPLIELGIATSKHVTGKEGRDSSQTEDNSSRREGESSSGKSHITINHLSGKNTDSKSGRRKNYEEEEERIEEEKKGEEGSNDKEGKLTGMENGPSSSPSKSSSLFPSKSQPNTFLNGKKQQRWSGTSEREKGIKIIAGEERRERKEEGNEMRKDDTSNIHDHSQEQRMDDQVKQLGKSQQDENVERGKNDHQVIVEEMEEEMRRSDERKEEERRNGREEEGSDEREGFKNEFRSIRSSLVVPSIAEEGRSSTSQSWKSPILILAFCSLIPLSLIILLVIQGMNERIASHQSQLPSVSCSSFSDSEYVLYTPALSQEEGDESRMDQISFVSHSIDLERDHQPLLQLRHGRDFVLHPPQSEEEEKSPSSWNREELSDPSQQVLHESLLDSSSSRLSLLDSSFPSCSSSSQRRF